MSTAASTAAETSTLKLEGELTIYRAAELKEMMLKVFNDASALEIDLSSVSDIDSAGLQLLMLLKKEASREKRELRLIGHSPAIIDAFDLLNLAGYFGDQVVIATASANNFADDNAR